MHSGVTRGGRGTLGKFGGNFGRNGKGEKEQGEGKKWREGKREAWKRGKTKRKRREIVKRKEGNLKWKGKVIKMSRWLFFFFFFLTFLFLKPLKFVLVVPKWKFLRSKNWDMGNFSNLAHLWLPTWLRPCLCISCGLDEAEIMLMYPWQRNNCWSVLILWFCLNRFLDYTILLLYIARKTKYCYVFVLLEKLCKLYVYAGGCINSQSNGFSVRVITPTAG